MLPERMVYSSRVSLAPQERGYRRVSQSQQQTRLPFHVAHPCSGHQRGMETSLGRVFPAVFGAQTF